MLEQLTVLKEKVARRAAQKVEFEQLEAEYELLDKELFALKIDAHNQQADVDLLNCFSFKNLYYDLTGKKEEMLAKETSEARAAKQKLDSAQFRLEQISKQLEVCSKEISALAGCEAEYWSVLKAAAETSPEAQIAFEARKAEVTTQLQNAMTAGNAALEQIYDTLKNIENVMGWNRSIAGTGWIMAMPGYLNGVQKNIEILRRMVVTFARRLDSLPLPRDSMLSPEEILNISKEHFRELTGNIGADQRLHEADNALHAAKDKILAIQAEIKTAQRQLL